MWGHIMEAVFNISDSITCDAVMKSARQMVIVTDIDIRIY